MTSDSESKSTHLLLGLALGAIGGLVTAILAHRDTRAAMRERSEKSVDYLNQQASNLRAAADVIVQQGKKLIACNGSDSVDQSTAASNPVQQEYMGKVLGA